MAGIFQQELSDVDARSATRQVRVPTSDFSGVLAAGQNVVGAVATKKAREAINAEQQSYLEADAEVSELGVQREEAERSLSQIQQENPEDDL